MTSAAFAALLAAASPSTGEVHRALWSDIRLNALIGNGNRRVTLEWTDGRDPDHPPTLRIANLSCRSSWGVARCRFDLLRELDPQSRTPDATPQPSRLRCAARLRRYQQPDGTRLWKVVHTPPWHGHSLTSMRCRIGRSIPSAV